jgi:AcrR family transcriptional regulator
MEQHPTQQKILDETIRIIETSGEASVRVHDIEVAVGITAPSIYHFFGSREGLIAEAQAERLLRSFESFNPFVDAAIATIDSQESARAVLHELLTGMYAPSRSLERQRRVFALGSSEGRPELAKRIAEMAQLHLRGIARRLQPLQDQGWIRADLDLEAFSFWLSGQVLGRVYIEIGWESPVYPEWDAISEEAVAYVLFGPE